MGRAHMLSTYLPPTSCRGSSSETAPGWVLSAPGICVRKEAELALCAEPETGSQCVRPQCQLRSGLGLRDGEFQKGACGLKDLRLDGVGSIPGGSRVPRMPLLSI